MHVACKMLGSRIILAFGENFSIMSGILVRSVVDASNQKMLLHLGQLQPLPIPVSLWIELVHGLFVCYKEKETRGLEPRYNKLSLGCPHVLNRGKNNNYV